MQANSDSNKIYLGIDISKATFVVAARRGEKIHCLTYSNDEKGVLSFLKTLGTHHHCILESTGNYDKRLLYALCMGNYQVSVITPMQSSAYAKVQKKITKTDNADAALLLTFGEKEQPYIYKISDDKILIIKQQRMVLRQLKRQKTAIKNQQEALNVLPNPDSFSLQQLQAHLAFIEQQIEQINERLKDFTQAEFKELMELVTSIKGIGTTIATALIEATNGFKDFENAKQFSKFVGLAPSAYDSGTSVKKTAHINKSGNPELRALLYTATWSSLRGNKACKEFYDELKRRGKASKVALIAVANKLIRQVFAVVRSNTPFDNEFKPKITL
jgi:transposase